MVLFVGRFKVFRGCQSIIARRSEDVPCDKSSISAFPSLIPPPPLFLFLFLFLFTIPSHTPIERSSNKRRELNEKQNKNKKKETHRKYIHTPEIFFFVSCGSV